MFSVVKKINLEYLIINHILLPNINPNIKQQITEKARITKAEIGSILNTTMSIRNSFWLPLFSGILPELLDRRTSFLAWRV